MKIALFATNIYPTPPINEKIVYAPLWLTHYIAEGLKKKGHQVYLFASDDSTSDVNIISDNLPSLSKNKEWNKAFGNSKANWRMVLRTGYEMQLVAKLVEMAQKDKFDIIQFHSMHFWVYLASLMKNTPLFYSFHDPLNFPKETKAVKLIYKTFHEKKIKNAHFISLSNTQRKPLPNLNYAGTVYNGIDVDRFKFSEKQGSYLAFAGRIIRGKGLDIAIRVAQKTNQTLKIASPVNDHKYWEKEIKPHLGRKIIYKGMLSQKTMVAFYQKAKAFLMPTLLEESFGLVLTEAMSCGTPVIGFNRGAVPEIIAQGKTGFVVHNERGMIQAVKKIDSIKREDCRQRVIENFSLQKMIDGYEKIYLKYAKNRNR